MCYEEYCKMFETDGDGAFLRLIIPASGERPELDLRNKKPSELSLDEVVWAKQYAAEMFKTVDVGTIG